MSDEKTMGQVIQIDEARIRDHPVFIDEKAAGLPGAVGKKRDILRHIGPAPEIPAERGARAKFQSAPCPVAFFNNT